MDITLKNAFIMPLESLGTEQGRDGQDHGTKTLYPLYHFLVKSKSIKFKKIKQGSYLFQT